MELCQGVSEWTTGMCLSAGPVQWIWEDASVRSWEPSFVSTGGNPQSFCFKTLCSIVKHFFQAFPYCFHLGAPYSLGRHSDAQTICWATSKMIVIMARGHFRLCEWIKAACQKKKKKALFPLLCWCIAIDWEWQHFVSCCWNCGILMGQKTWKLGLCMKGMSWKFCFVFVQLH